MWLPAAAGAGQPGARVDHTLVAEDDTLYLFGGVSGADKGYLAELWTAELKAPFMHKMQEVSREPIARVEGEYTRGAPIAG
eukprot:9483673-Pyramimonas_sp.AAC.2